MRFYSVVVLGIFVVLLSAGTASAIGIGMFTTEIDFSPGLNQNFEAFINNNVGSPIIVQLEAVGELGEYVTFTEDVISIPAGTRHFFTFNLKLPESIPPGKNRIDISAVDISGGTTGFSVKTAIKKPFIVHAPFTGKYVTAALRVPEVVIGDEARFVLDLEHKGAETITKVTGKLEIREQSVEGPEVAVFALPSLTKFSPNEVEEIAVVWDVSEQFVGDYFALATLNLDGKEQSVKGNAFRIGELLVVLQSYNDTFSKKGIVPMQVFVRNLWNQPIESVYAELSIRDLFLRSSEKSLHPGKREAISLYLDTDALGIGQHFGELTIFYAGKNLKEDVTISVTEIAELRSPGLEVQPVVLVALVALVLINVLVVVYFFRKRPHSKFKRKRR